MCQQSVSTPSEIVTAAPLELLLAEVCIEGGGHRSDRGVLCDGLTGDGLCRAPRPDAPHRQPSRVRAQQPDPVDQQVEVEVGMGRPALPRTSCAPRRAPRRRRDRTIPRSTCPCCRRPARAAARSAPPRRYAPRAGTAPRRRRRRRIGRPAPTRRVDPRSPVGVYHAHRYSGSGPMRQDRPTLRHGDVVTVVARPTALAAADHGMELVQADARAPTDELEIDQQLRSFRVSVVARSRIARTISVTDPPAGGCGRARWHAMGRGRR